MNLTKSPTTPVSQFIITTLTADDRVLWRLFGGRMFFQTPSSWYHVKNEFLPEIKRIIKVFRIRLKRGTLGKLLYYMVDNCHWLKDGEFQTRQWVWYRYTIPRPLVDLKIRNSSSLLYFFAMLINVEQIDDFIYIWYKMICWDCSNLLIAFVEFLWTLGFYMLLVIWRSGYS